MIDIGYLENNDFDVVVSTPKKVGREWRLVMVDGKVAEYSLYRQYQMVKPEHSVLPEVIEFAEKSASKYNPYDVFVLDVVETDDGLKVIEYNTFNSAGLYKVDVANLINKINAFIGE